MQNKKIGKSAEKTKLHNIRIHRVIWSRASLTTEDSGNLHFGDHSQRACRHALHVPVFRRAAVVADRELEAAVVCPENCYDEVVRALDGERAALAGVARTRVFRLQHCNTSTAASSHGETFLGSVASHRYLCAHHSGFNRNLPFFARII